MYMIIKSPAYPLVTLLKGDIGLAAIQRNLVKTHFEGIVYIKNILGHMLSNFLTYWAYVYYKKTKDRFYKIIFYLNMLLVTLFLTFDTQKAPILFYISGFLVLNILLGERMKLKKMLTFLFGIFILLLLFYLKTDNKGLFRIINLKGSLFTRIFAGQIGGYFLSLQYFNDTNRTWSAGLPNVITKLLSLPNEKSSRVLYTIIDPSAVEKGTAGVVNSFFMAEAWANYGYIGILMAPFIVGTIIYFFHNITIRNSKTPLKLALYIYVTIKWQLMVNFVDFLYMKIIFYPLLIYLTIKLFSNTLKRLSKESKN